MAANVTVTLDSYSEHEISAAMPSAASSQKELRFALLSLFPSAGLKEVSEAGGVAQDIEG